MKWFLYEAFLLCLSTQSAVFNIYTPVASAERNMGYLAQGYLAARHRTTNLLINSNLHT